MSSSGGCRRQSRVTVGVMETKPVVTEKGPSKMEMKEKRREFCSVEKPYKIKVFPFFFLKIKVYFFNYSLIICNGKIVNFHVSRVILVISKLYE